MCVQTPRRQRSHDSQLVVDADTQHPYAESIDMAVKQYAYLQHLQDIHNITITLSEGWHLGTGSTSPTPLETYVQVLANILQYVPTSKLRTLSLHIALTPYQELELSAVMARTSGLAYDPSDHLTSANTFGRLREMEDLILQFPVLIAVWFDATPRPTRMQDFVVQKMFLRLQMKGVLRTIGVSSGNLSEYLL